MSTALLRMFTNPSPFIPLPLQRGEGRDLREGRSPSLTYTPPSLIKGRRQGDRLLNELLLALR